jgi:hypothetical protein
VASPVTPSIPSFVAGGTFQSGASALTVPWPTAQANDVALLIVLQLSDTTVTLSTSSGSGASNFVQIGSTVTFGTLSMAVFWSRASSSSPFSPVVAANANDSCAQIVTFRGCSQDGNPFDVSATSGTATASTSVSVTGATDLQKNEMVVAICGYNASSATPQSSGWTNANLANPALTKEVDNSTTLSGGLAVAVGGFAAGGAYGTSTATLATSSVQVNVSLSLKPTWNVDATANKAWPNGPNEWAAMLTALSIASMTVTDNYTLQDSGSPLADNGTGAISLPVQVGSGNIAYQQALSGFSRKGISFTNNAVGAFYNTTFPNPSTTSYYAVLLLDITAIVAGTSVLNFGGSAGILVTMASGGLLECQAWNGSSFNAATGTQAMTSVGTVPIILQYDRTNLVTRIITPYEVITPTWQGALSSGDTILELGYTGGTPAFVAGGLAFFEGTSAEVALAVSQTLLTGLGYGTAWGVDVPAQSWLDDGSTRKFAQARAAAIATYPSYFADVWFPPPVVEVQGALAIYPDQAGQREARGLDMRRRAPSSFFVQQPGITDTDVAMLGHQAPIAYARPRVAHLSPYLSFVQQPGVTDTNTSSLVVTPDLAEHREHRVEDAVSKHPSYFAPVWVPAGAVPTLQGMYAVYPDLARQREARLDAVRRAPSYFAPLFVPPPIGPAFTQMLVQAADVALRRPRVDHLAPWLFEPFPFVVVPPYDPSGPVLVVLMESGRSSVTLEWATEIHKAWSGAEYRAALLSGPRRVYDATALLVDGDRRDVRTNLLVNAANGAAFLLGVPWEEATILAPSAGTVVTVASVAELDWVVPGQRVIAISPDLTTATAVVQGAVSPTQFSLDTALGSDCGQAGARIMPLVPVYLDQNQGFARYPIGAEAWQLKARAARFGYAGSDAMGNGATLAYFADPTLGSVPVWDHGLMSSGEEPAPDSVQTLADLIDLGGVPLAKGSAPYVDMGRAIRFESSEQSDWQWLKLFLATVRGRQLSWLAPTGRPDLVLAATPTGPSLLVYKDSGGTTGYGDFIQWFNAGLGKRLCLTLSTGAYQYVSVTAAIDNGNGTATLTISATPSSTVSMVSFLDLCRFESDDIEVRWGAPGGLAASFRLDTIARVVQQ